MKITEDRLAVARAVRDTQEKLRGDLHDVDLQELIESLPEPEPLPAPDVQAQIDAAVARERGEIEQIIETHERAFSNDEEQFTGAVVLAQLRQILYRIRTRSGARGE